MTFCLILRVFQHRTCLVSFETQEEPEQQTCQEKRNFSQHDGQALPWSKL